MSKAKDTVETTIQEWRDADIETLKNRYKITM